MYHSCRAQIIGDSTEVVNYSLPSLPSPHSVCWMVIESVTKTDRNTQSVSQYVRRSVWQCSQAVSTSTGSQSVSQSIILSVSQSAERPVSKLVYYVVHYILSC